MTTTALPSSATPLSRAVRSLLVAASLSGAGLAGATPVSWDDIANDHLSPQNVLQYGLGTNAQRWSPLAQVNDGNVF